jgi:ketosteroid isomerase-like protein
VVPSENSAGVVRSAYDAFARLDLESALALLHPDIEWIRPDVLPWGGVWRVVDGRVTWFRNFVDTAALLRALHQSSS